jgi:hypothetical protein
MVTYGGMSQQPITVKTGPLVFDNLALRGYWHSRWLAETAAASIHIAGDHDGDHDPRQALLDELVDAAILHHQTGSGGIQLPPMDLVSLSPNKDNDSDDDDIVTKLMNHAKKQSRQPIRHKLVLDLRET